MVTQEELKRAAELSKLSLAGLDEDKLLRDINEMVDFAKAASAAASPSSQPFPREAAVLRPDEVRDSLTADAVLKNAHERSENFYLARGKELTAE